MTTSPQKKMGGIGWVPAVWSTPGAGPPNIKRCEPCPGQGFVELNGVDIMVHVNDCKPEDVEASPSNIGMA